MARKAPTFEYLANQKSYVRVIHISAPSPPGTSGGCWLDANGKVIGNQSAFMSKDGVGLGIALVPPLDAIRRLVRTRSSASTPSAGTAFEELWSQPHALIARFPKGSEGLLPVLPVKDGPARKAGLVGDILITTIDKQTVRDRDTMMTYMRTKKPGDQVVFTVMEPDKFKIRKITVTLTELEDSK